MACLVVNIILFIYFAPEISIFQPIGQMSINHLLNGGDIFSFCRKLCVFSNMVIISFVSSRKKNLTIIYTIGYDDRQGIVPYYIL